METIYLAYKNIWFLYANYMFGVWELYCNYIGALSFYSEKHEKTIIIRNTNTSLNFLK